MCKSFKYSFFLIFLAILSSQCRKSDLRNPNGDIVVKGEITLVLQAKHHSWGVPYIEIYLKRNATQFPGKDTANYDLKVQADNEGYATFTGLYPGSYYVYATGFDYYWGANVLGYSPIVLNSSTVVNNMSEMTLYVSE